MEEDQINPYNIKIPTEIIEEYFSESKLFQIINKNLFENIDENWGPKIGQKTSIRGSSMEISAEVIILDIIHQLVRSFV